jgi:uncharacterized membrane protein
MVIVVVAIAGVLVGLCRSFSVFALWTDSTGVCFCGKKLVCLFAAFGLVVCWLADFAFWPLSVLQWK